MAETDIEIDMGDGIKVNGRIDLVKRKNVDGVDKAYIVNFKTANREVQESIHKEQLKIYASGYQELAGTKADDIEVYQLDSENSARENCSKCHFNYLCLSKAEKKDFAIGYYVRGDKKIGSTEVSSKNGER